MEDVGRQPDTSAVPLEPASIPTLDGWIESLMSCKQLAEVDVQRLCDKVRIADENGLVMVEERGRVLDQS